MRFRILMLFVGSILLTTFATATFAIGDGYKLPRPVISADYPYESHYIEILGSNIHYIESGKGDPIVFIHGNPTSSYLWRNIIPFVTPHGRAIALDLIGMGKSDKPEIEYTYTDHFQYVKGFIEALDLDHITLVVHDWGAALGFDYARRFPDKIKAIAFMEGPVPLFPAASLDALPPPLSDFFRAMRDPVIGYESIVVQNSFVEQTLPAFINRPLSEAEMAFYRAPYPTESSRIPLWVWPNEVPIGGSPLETTTILNQVKDFMQNTEIPMLLLYASPGAIVTADIVTWYTNNIKHLESNFVGQGFHFIQEDQPKAVGLAISDWMRRLDD